MPKIVSLEETARKKKIVFQGHDEGRDSILESSVMTAFLLLPKPLDRVAQVVYAKQDGTLEDKTDAVINYFDIMRTKNEAHYNKVKISLDDILNRLEGTDYDPVIPGKNDDIVLIIKELLIADEQSSESLLQELSKFIPSQQ